MNDGIGAVITGKADIKPQVTRIPSASVEQSMEPPPHWRANHWCGEGHRRMTPDPGGRLAANSRIDKTALLPFRPYGRSGISCIVNQNNGKLLSSTNIAFAGLHGW